jgi:hypothetical protein
MRPQRFTLSCSVCGRGGRIRRTWCTLHYQRWLSTGDPNKTMSVEPRTYHHPKVMFSRAMWDRWLAECNRAPSHLAAGIDHFRRLCAKQEPT